VTRSGIITLTTDFGLRDPYVAAMKGVVLSIFPKAVVVDVTHEVPPGNVREAADTLARSAPFFPSGTVHVAVVDPGVGGERRAVAACAGGHLFVGPDNGLFWPVIGRDPERRVFHLQNERYFRTPVSRTFHGRDVFAPVAGYLASGLAPDLLGEPIPNPVRLETRGPERTAGGLTGEITRVDRFGNLITNIREEDLKRGGLEDGPVIEAGELRVFGMRSSYDEVPLNEPLAIIGSNGFLELSMNRGRASDRIGLDGDNAVGGEVRVRFRD